MAATVMVLVGMLVAPLLAAASEPPPTIPTVSCTTGSVASYEVRQPGSVMLKCPDKYTTWAPALSNNTVESVGTTQACTSGTPLSTVCPGAVGSAPQTAGAKQNQQAATPLNLTLSFPQLPASDTTFYMACYKSTADRATETTEGCSFALTVKSPPPEGPQACAVKGSTVNLGIVGEGGKTQFACGNGLNLTPTDPKKIFKEDCMKTEDLKNLALAQGTDGYYTLSSTKKHNKKVCYLCSPTAATKGKASDNCAILIDVSAGSGLVARSAFGMALSCALTLLHLA